MKKLLLGLGAVAAVITPVATVVACGAANEQEPGNTPPKSSSTQLELLQKIQKEFPVEYAKDYPFESMIPNENVKSDTDYYADVSYDPKMTLAAKNIIADPNYYFDSTSILQRANTEIKLVVNTIFVTGKLDLSNVALKQDVMQKDGITEKELMIAVLYKTFLPIDRAMKKVTDKYREEAIEVIDFNGIKNVFNANYSSGANAVKLSPIFAPGTVFALDVAKD